jgi:trans-L-3-hydroxyproline dehydratase
MVDVTNGISGKVKFTSVPAFAFDVDVKLPTKSYGEISLDIGYGGTFYALIPDKELGVDIRKSTLSELKAAAKETLEMCREKLTVRHPEEDDLAFIYGVIITDGKDQFAESKDEPTCNMCYFGDGQVRINIRIKIRTRLRLGLTVGIRINILSKYF